MSFWDITSDGWMRGNSIVSVYRFRTSKNWYYNSWYNEHLEIHGIIQLDEDGFREGDLLEEFQDIVDHFKQQWPNEYETISEKRIDPKPYRSHYYIDSSADISRRRNTKFRRSHDHRRNLDSDEVTTFISRKPQILSRKDQDKKINEQGEYPLEIVRFNDLIKIIVQTPIIYDKNSIIVKIYNDTSIEISVDDTQQNKKKYYRIIEVPSEADIETAKCTYRNGVLEITFKQRKKEKKTSLDKS
jgi:HSP20 family molecular chaperone IbpA